MRSSPTLSVVLLTALEVGNLLHLGTNRGGTRGIRLESLAKMKDIKVTNTLAHTPHTQTKGEGGREGKGEGKGEREREEGRKDAPPHPHLPKGKEGLAKVRTLLDYLAYVCHRDKGVKEGIGASVPGIPLACSYPQADLVDLLTQITTGIMHVGQECESCEGDELEFARTLREFSHYAACTQTEIEKRASKTLGEAKELNAFFGEKAEKPIDQTFQVLKSFGAQFDHALKAFQ